MAHMRNEYPRHKQRTSPRQAIGPIGLVSYNSETLSENHYRKCFRLFEPSSLNAFAAKTHHKPRNAISHAAPDAAFFYLQRSSTGTNSTPS